MVLNFDWSVVLEVFYSLCGFLLIATGVIVLQDKTNKTHIGSALFWLIAGIIFIGGGFIVKSTADGGTSAGIPAEIFGGLIIVLGLLSAFKQVNIGQIPIIKEAFRAQQAKRLGNKIFIPSVVLALSAFLIAQFLPSIMPEAQRTLGGQIAIGLSALIGLIFALLITHAAPHYVIIDGARLIQQMGPSSILPQLLATLGVLFTMAGVGDIIGGLLSSVVPNGNVFIGVLAYCIGMAVFTIIMGNAFAAFAVITSAIGIPFVIAHGGNPAIIGALGLTSGYCGTLLTPMAANFNILPANLLETKNQYTVIRFQTPFALVLLVVHIVFMYVFGFWR